MADVEIMLLHDGMTLAGDDRLGWSAAMNLAAIGDELVQFGRAERIGPARWRLSRLLRGRRGTEWAVVGMQQPGVSTPVGGSVVDTEARAAITALISSLAAHGLIAR